MAGVHSSGYPREVIELFESKGIRIGDRIRVIKEGKVFEGILMPRYSLDMKPIIVVKLDNGYNVGIRLTKDVSIERIETAKSRTYYDELASRILEEVELKNTGAETGKKVIIVGTGGTIASRIEYETGAVKPAMTAEEIIESVPEVKEVADIESRILFNILSENMTPSHWMKLIEELWRLIKSGKYDGIIVAHGTDTMTYTASAVAFAIQNLPAPIVFVGAQRSSDRPSSDAALNLVSAVIAAANLDAAESVIVMHGEISDSYSLVHRAVKTRKMHTSRRDAFQTINGLPIAKIDPLKKKIEYLSEPLLRRGRREAVVANKFEEKVALLKYYPGMKTEIIDFLVDSGYKGVVLEGTGLGHVGEYLIPSLKRAYREGVVVVMTSQCIFGRVNMNVYATGRKLLAEAKVIPASDMTPETAYVKLSWLLGNYNDPETVRSLFTKNIVGEINERHLPEYYPRWYHG